MVLQRCARALCATLLQLTPAHPHPLLQRALIGRMLIKHTVALATGQSWHAMQLKRSAAGKPELVTPPAAAPRFNFNISHHGDWVAIVAHDAAAVGCDVSKVQRPRGTRSVADFFRTMRECFTAREWAAIRQGDGGAVRGEAHAAASEAAWETAALGRFYRNWTLKESFTKAIGIGLGFDLQRIEFRALPLAPVGGVDGGADGASPRFEVWVDGRHRAEWAFVCATLDDAHPITVALGPWLASVDEHCARFAAPPAADEPASSIRIQDGSPEGERELLDFGARFAILSDRDLLASMSLRDRVVAGFC